MEIFVLNMKLECGVFNLKLSFVVVYVLCDVLLMTPKEQKVCYDFRHGRDENDGVPYAICHEYEMKLFLYDRSFWKTAHPFYTSEYSNCRVRPRRCFHRFPVSSSIHVEK